MDVDYAAISGDVARLLLGAPNDKLSRAGELRFGGKGSVKVDTTTGVWWDYESGEGGGVLDLIRREVPGSDPAEWLRREGLAGGSPPPPRADTAETGAAETDTAETGAATRTPEPPSPPAPGPTRTSIFNYSDEAGVLLYQSVRVDAPGRPKQVRQRRPAPGGGWVWKLGDARRVLYRLPELLAAGADRTVHVAEGEPKVDLLRSWGLVATCNVGGAGKWPDDRDQNEAFRGRSVVILPDNDPPSVDARGRARTWPDGRPRRPGQDHAQAVARRLLGIAAEVKILELPGLPPKGDVVDWARAGGTPEELMALSRGAPPWQPPPEEAGSDDGIVPPPLSEESMALTMATLHERDLRCVSEWGRWYMWTGTVWRPDDRREAFNLSRGICRAAAFGVEDKRLARAVASARTRAAVLSLTSEDPRIAASPAQWDSDEMILNTPGGVVDLRTGELRGNRADDYCTKTTSVAPGGECPRWLQFLDQITAGNQELVGYLRRAAGYALTGSTVEQCLLFFYGLGGNGKSRFVGAASGVLKDYHVAAPIETFMATPTDRHPTDLAMLRGARLVTAVETEEGRRWDESRISILTGGDPISARFMRQDFFEFTPQFKLLIIGNHKPSLRTINEAVRRRMNVVPFNVTIPKVEQDQRLGEKLREEWPGILQWMIDGCLEWQSRRLDPPEVVVAATGRYLDQEDTFKAWIGDCCEAGADRVTPVGWLFYSWRRWAEAAGEYVGSQKRFSQRLESEGFAPDRTYVGGKRSRVFRGVGLTAGTAGPSSEPTDGVQDLPY